MFVVIEGIDGSGKATQAHLLHQRALESGITSAKFAFPQYGKNPFAEGIKEYLNGCYGGVRDVHPKLASLLFAGDRFASRSRLMEVLQKNSLVVCDRYVTSNLAHQSAKLDEGERDAFLLWLTSIEYSIFGLPSADLTIYLDMPVRLAKKLVLKKTPRDQTNLFNEDGQGTYTDLKADIHESDPLYLASCRQSYLEICQRSLGGRWETVQCTNEDGSLKDAGQIGKEVWEIVHEHLVVDLRNERPGSANSL